MNALDHQGSNLNAGQARAGRAQQMQSCDLLSFAGQVVHARPDILIVRVDLDVEELPLGVEGSVCLLKPHQLSFPALAVTSLIPDVL